MAILRFAINKSDRKFRISLPEIFLSCFLALVTLDVLRRPGVHLTMRFTECLGLALIYIGLRQVPAKHTGYLLLSVVIAGIVQAAHGLLQLYGYLPSSTGRLDSSGNFFNSGPYAGYLASILPVSLGLYLKDSLRQETSKPERSDQQRESSWRPVLNLVALAGVLSITMVIISTKSRAAWLAALLGAGCLFSTCFAGFSRTYLNTLNRKITACVSGAVVLIFLSAALYFFKKDSADGRILIWKITLKMAAAHPFMGIGYDRFRSEYMNHQKDYFLHHINAKESVVADDVFYTFNEPLHLWAETGMAGCLLMLIALMLLLLTKPELWSPGLILAKAGFVSILVFGFFSYPSEILPIKLNAVVYMAILSAHSRMFTLHFAHRWSVFYRMAAVFLLPVIAVIYLSWQGYLARLYRAFEDCNVAVMYYQSGHYNNAAAYYKSAFPVLSADGPFLMQNAKALMLNHEPEDALKVARLAEKYYNNTVVQITIGDACKMLKRYKEAEEAYNNAHWMTPGRLYPQYLLARLYLESEQKNKAVALAEELLLKKPKFESTAAAEIHAEMKKIISHRQPGKL